MDITDETDSLFAGMEFVNPFSLSDTEVPLPSPRTLSSPLDLHDFSDQIAVSKTIAASNTQAIPAQKTSEKPDEKGKPHNDSIDSILAAYDSGSLKTQSSLTKQNVDSSKLGVRRKRRSVKIGYGRDDTEDVRSTDETAINGSSIEDHSSGFSELIDVGKNGMPTGRKEAGHSLTKSGSSGHQREISMTSDDFDAKQEELVENFTMLSEPLDIEDADIRTSEVQVSAIGTELGKVADSRKLPSSPSIDSGSKEIGFQLANEIPYLADAEPQEAILKPVAASSDPQSAYVREETSLDIIDHENDGMENDISDITVAPTYHECEADTSDLKVKISPGSSMEERLDLIKKAIATHAANIQKKISTISQARKEAARNRRNLAEVVSQTAAKYKEVEEEIQVACEREDFETAEKLDEALVLAETARQAALEEFRAVESEYDKYASEMQDVIQMQIASQEESFLLMEQLAQEAVDRAEQMKKDSDDMFKAKVDGLAADEDALKSEKERLMQEVHIVQEAKSELKKAIESSAQMELEEKQALVEERQHLQQELDALLAALRLKEREIADHDEKIEDLEERIQARVAGFDTETLELEANLQNLGSSLDQLQKKSDGLDALKTQVDVAAAQAQIEAEKLNELSKVAKIEAEKLQDALLVRKAAAQAAASSKEKRLSLVAQEKQHIEDAHSLRNQSASLRNAVQELASNKVKMHQELLSANQQISSIEKRGPEIEAEKKLAAGSRNFKEAGRLAAEAKALLSSKEKLVVDVTRVTNELQGLEDELESRMSELSELEVQLQLKEKEAAMARCERLRLIAAAARDERDAARELEDVEEAKSLDMEAEAADREADGIQQEIGCTGGDEQ